MYVCVYICVCVYTVTVLSGPTILRGTVTCEACMHGPWLLGHMSQLEYTQVTQVIITLALA